MKKLVTTAALSLLGIAGFTPSAQAATPYISGSYGLAMLGNSNAQSYDSGHVLTGAVGIENGNYRVEGELGSQKNDIKGSTAEISSTTIMGNGYYDVKLPMSPIKPFLMGGIGFADFEGISGQKQTFAWQLGAGVAFSLIPTMKLDVQYRHVAASPEFSGVKYSVDSDNVMLGIRIGL